MLVLLELTKSSTDESMKSSAFLVDVLLDPATAHSEETSDAPCLRFCKEKSFFEHLHAPGNEYQNTRFQAAMGGLAASDSSSAVVPGGFPWETLPEGTKIVDVGGGIGTACHEIMKKNPSLKFTVQDLPSVTDDAVAVSSSTFAFVFRRMKESMYSTGTSMSPRRSQVTRSQSKLTISSLLNRSMTRTSSCSGTSYTTGQTQRRSRFSSG